MRRMSLSQRIHSELNPSESTSSMHEVIAFVQSRMTEIAPSYEIELGPAMFRYKHNVLERITSDYYEYHQTASAARRAIAACHFARITDPILFERKGNNEAEAAEILDLKDVAYNHAFDAVYEFPTDLDAQRAYELLRNTWYMLCRACPCGNSADYHWRCRWNDSSPTPAGETEPIPPSNT